MNDNEQQGTIKISEIVSLLGGNVYINNKWVPTDENNFRERIKGLLKEEERGIHASMVADEARRW